MSSAKVKIANLFGQLRLFRPEMVDKVWTGKFLVNEKANPDEVPDRDKLLNLIGEAAGEMKDWAQEFNTLQIESENQLAGVVQVHNAVTAMLSPEDASLDLVQNLLLVKGRYQQMIAFIHNIANNLPQDKVKLAASEFLKFKGGKLTLVNQNAETAPLPIPDATICTCLKPDPYKNSGFIGSDPACPIHGCNCEGDAINSICPVHGHTR